MVLVLIKDNDNNHDSNRNNDKSCSSNNNIINDSNNNDNNNIMIINTIIDYFAFIMDAMRLSYWLRRVCRIALGTKIEKIGNAISRTDPKAQLSINITVIIRTTALLVAMSIMIANHDSG